MLFALICKDKPNHLQVRLDNRPAHVEFLRALNEKGTLKIAGPFLNDEGVRLIGVEAAGEGMETGRHAAAINGGRPGVLHGNMTYLLQDDEGQITEAHSISAGLDYPGIGPEHSWLHDVGRATYLTCTDQEALDAFKLLAELEGILPAIESSHALARLPEVCAEVGKDGIVVLNLSGRGDKDVATVAAHLGRTI